MRPRVVLTGSFRRDRPGLRRLFRECEATGCRVLSPISLDFDDAEFVRARAEQDLSPTELERFHLRALRDADFIMLHAPGGYIGLSSAYELGFADALGKPTFSLHAPADAMLASCVRTVGSVFEALEQLQLTSF